MNVNNVSVIQSTLARYNPSAFLLAAQLLSLVLYVALDGVPGGSLLLGIFGILILLLVVLVVIRSPAISWIAWVIAVPVFVLTLFSWLYGNPALLVWAALLEGILYFYGAGGLIVYMLGDERVTIDELFAVGATFTLLAWGFAYMYMVCQAWSPASFSGGTNPKEPLSFVELLSLSFTNLSATGLSDIVPVAPASRVLVMLEQFAGVGYIAVVVSRLIGLTLSQRGDRK